jgi:D-alanyl-D-alanine endopeptidase (penicillin-binding protein 7)
VSVMTPTVAPLPVRRRAASALAGLFLSAALLVPGEVSFTAGSSGEASAAAATRAKSKSGPTAKASTTRKSAATKKSVSRARTKSKGKATRKRARRAPRVTGGVNARAALVMDARTGEVLFDKNSGTAMPIASLTKLMTAMVLVETKPEWSRRVMVSREDLAGSGHTKLRAGEVLTLRDLMHLALLSSDNAATKSMVRNSDLPPEEFLARMNRKAQVMGLHQTRFVEFTGLSEQNVSTATEYAQILKRAGNEPLIQHITTLPDYTFRTSRGDHHLVNTNRLCRFGVFDVRGGKTGFINEAGYCLATWVSTRTRDVISVVLGAPSNSVRFAETRRLIDRWAAAPTTAVAVRGAN